MATSKSAKTDDGSREKRQGDNFVLQGEYNEAVDWYSKALEKSPENESFWTARSSALLKMHCCRESLLDARTAVQLAPNWHEGYFQLGKAFQEMNMHGYAQTAYQNAMRICPAFDDAEKSLSSLTQMLSDRHKLQEKSSGEPLSVCQTVYSGDLEAVRKCLEGGKGLSPEFVTLPHRELFMTPLQVALLNQYFDIAKLLMDRGVLFPENVCDWMIAQTLDERKKKAALESELAMSRQEVSDLQRALASEKSHSQQLMNQIKSLENRLSNADGAFRAMGHERDDAKASVSSLKDKTERIIRDLENRTKSQEARIKALDANLMRVTSERDNLTNFTEHLKSKIDVQVVHSEEKMQSFAWRAEVNMANDTVQIIEVPKALDPAAAGSEISKCLQQCHRSSGSYQQAVASLMKARHSDSSARATTRELLALAEASATWEEPVNVGIEDWCRLKVDLKSELARKNTSSVYAMRGQLTDLSEMKDRKYAWEALPDVVADLYNQVDHLLMMLTANNIPDEKYAAVVGEIVADLKRGLREEPMSVHLTSLKDMESDATKIIPEIQKKYTRLQETDPVAATAEFHKQVDLMESVVRLLLKKIDTMNAGNDSEATKLKNIVLRCDGLIKKIESSWDELGNKCKDDKKALKQVLKEKQAKDFVSASSEKQQAFSSALNENEKKQDEQWAAVKTSLTQIGELQEKRIALIQDRLGQVWTLKREEKIHERLLDIALQKSSQLEMIQGDCSRASEVTSLLFKFTTSYSDKVTRALKDAHSTLTENALQLHRSFYQWFVTWIKEQYAHIQWKKVRLQRLTDSAARLRGQQSEAHRKGDQSLHLSEKLVETEKERKALEDEVRRLESTLKEVMPMFDAKGHTAEYFKNHGISFTHPTSFVTPPKPSPEKTPPVVRYLGTETYTSPSSGTNYQYSSQYSSMPSYGFGSSTLSGNAAFPKYGEPVTTPNTAFGSTSAYSSAGLSSLPSSLPSSVSSLSSNLSGMSSNLPPNMPTGSTTPPAFPGFQTGLQFPTAYQQGLQQHPALQQSPARPQYQWH